MLPWLILALLPRLVLPLLSWLVLALLSGLILSLLSWLVLALLPGLILSLLPGLVLALLPGLVLSLLSWLVLSLLPGLVLALLPGLILALLSGLVLPLLSWLILLFPRLVLPLLSWLVLALLSGLILSLLPRLVLSLLSWLVLALLPGLVLALLPGLVLALLSWLVLALLPGLVLALLSWLVLPCCPCCYPTLLPGLVLSLLSGLVLSLLSLLPGLILALLSWLVLALLPGLILALLSWLVLALLPGLILSLLPGCDLVLGAGLLGHVVVIALARIVLTLLGRGWVILAESRLDLVGGFGGTAPGLALVAGLALLSAGLSRVLSDRAIVGVGPALRCVPALSRLVVGGIPGLGLRCGCTRSLRVALSLARLVLVQHPRRLLKDLLILGSDLGLAVRGIRGVIGIPTALRGARVAGGRLAVPVSRLLLIGLGDLILLIPIALFLRVIPFRGLHLLGALLRHLVELLALLRLLLLDFLLLLRRDRLDDLDDLMSGLEFIGAGLLVVAHRQPVRHLVARMRRSFSRSRVLVARNSVTGGRPSRKSSEVGNSLPCW